MTLDFAYLLIASLFQVCWLYTIKALNKSKLKSIRFKNIFTFGSFLAILPFLGYVVFGLGNITFFTMAMDTIPTSTCYAMWTGAVMCLAATVDKFYFRHKYSFLQYAFLILIIVGIIGLKTYTMP